MTDKHITFIVFIALLLGVWIGYVGMSIGFQQQCGKNHEYRDGAVRIKCEVTK